MMSDEAAKALTEALTAHTEAMGNLAHELNVFSTYGFEDAVDKFDTTIDSIKELVENLPSVSDF